MADKLQDYKNRHKEWRDISVTQLSNTNNILLTLSSGLLAFCIDKSKVTKLHLNLHRTIDCEATIYWISIFMLGFSIAFGIGVLLTRLYDFRISRHIALTRQRFYKKYENDKEHTKELSYTYLGEFNWKDRIFALWHIIFFKLPFITSVEIDTLNKPQIEIKFQGLRRTQNILGTATWRWTKLQIILFLLSGFMYFIHRLF